MIQQNYFTVTSLRVPILPRNIIATFVRLFSIEQTSVRVKEKVLNLVKKEEAAIASLVRYQSSK